MVLSPSVKGSLRVRSVVDSVAPTVRLSSFVPM